jgi:hypothetical protein
VYTLIRSTEFILENTEADAHILKIKGRKRTLVDLATFVPIEPLHSHQTSGKLHKIIKTDNQLQWMKKCEGDDDTGEFKSILEGKSRIGW